ncbi:MAG: MBL fold metallo-hydrolase [Candidatus Thermoplasmatota archaeon]|nr:MBL fold metallo-hydrolase [Candidatus Thermoplasmatota archaeon]
MKVEQLKTGHMDNFTYLLWDEKSKKGAIIDTPNGSMRMVTKARALGVKIEAILLTHGHGDHMADMENIKTRTGAQVIAHILCPAKKDVEALDEQVIEVGSMEIRVLHTPGHSPGSVCYIAGSNLFTGDTLFVGECGRTDIAGGDSSKLYNSIFHKLAQLPDDTIVWPGHDYGRAPTSTLGEERANSYIFNPRRTEEEFVKFMAE